MQSQRVSGTGQIVHLIPVEREERFIENFNPAFFIRQTQDERSSTDCFGPTGADTRNDR